MWLTASAVAMNVLTGTMTSSPGCTPAPSSASFTASVPELTPTAWAHPHSSAKEDSKACSSGPIV